MDGKVSLTFFKANGDHKKVWDIHCSDKGGLEKYASAMRKLAVNHWTKQSPEGRIEWCYSTVMDFFKGGGLRKLMEKQRRRREFSLDVNACCCCFERNESGANLDLVEKLYLLDVGSCFNPFAAYNDFYSVPIDLQPAVTSVYKCDFLHLDVQDIPTSGQEFSHCEKCGTMPLSLSPDVAAPERLHNSGTKNPNLEQDCKTSFMNITDKNPQKYSISDKTNSWYTPVEDFIKEGEDVKVLPAGSFHVIIFSLLLSYFPSYVQRWECCKKAHRLLCTNGILLVITPDSCHQNKNSAMMKSWKTGIQSLGFVRWKYQKQTHLHCMAFRKVAPCHTYHHSSGSSELMYIPQDFQEEEEEVRKPLVSFHSEKDESQIMAWLSELSDL